MQLYLSSYRFGANAGKALQSVDRTKPAAIIPNALDFSEDLERREGSLEREIADLRDFGISSRILDLRDWFDRPEPLREELRRYAMLWVVGGNTFILRQSFHLSGLDELLREGVDCTPVYGGYSAGVCVLAPTLKGIHLADEPDIHPEGYPQETLWDGLNIIPYCIVPHFESDHAESAAMSSVVGYYIENKIPFVVLRDGEDMVR